jgi:S1-C subfamily serine protease
MKFFLNIILLSLISLSSTVYAADLHSNIVDKAKKASVSIQTRISNASYLEKGIIGGSGFIVDKKLGLIVTNAHVISPGSVSSYVVTFFNGKTADAKLAYYDSWQDYAILQIDSTLIPSETEDIQFSKKMPSVNEAVFLIGNNEGKGFSMHSGYISDLYHITGMMPQQTYVINLNVKGGSSGSPVLNKNGEMIGVHYGGGETFGLSLNGEYIKYALDSIKSNNTPQRQHIGIITTTYSLDTATLSRNFPRHIMSEYVTKHPEARNKVIVVNSIIKGSPAENILKSGDILWQVNGKEICSSLYILDNAMNISKDKVTLTIFRNGTKMHLDVPLYDVNNIKINKMISFGGATIFESSDLVSAKTGIPLKSVSIINIENGSIFSSINECINLKEGLQWRMHILSINNQQVTDIESCMKAIESIPSNAKYITVEFNNHQAFFQGFDGIFCTEQSIKLVDIMLDPLERSVKFFTFSDDAKSWVAK